MKEKPLSCKGEVLLSKTIGVKDFYAISVRKKLKHCVYRVWMVDLLVPQYIQQVSQLFGVL